MSHLPTYQPLNDYKDRYCELHRTNTKDFFENCVKSGNIDEKANRKTVEKINQQKVKIAKIGSSLRKKRILKVFLIVVIVLLVCTFLLFLFKMLQG